jgi:hypothetical protein
VRGRASDARVDDARLDDASRSRVESHARSIRIDCLNNLIASRRDRDRAARRDVERARDDARDDRVEVGDGEARARREGGAKDDAATREGRRSDDGGDSAGGDESDG